MKNENIEKLTNSAIDSIEKLTNIAGVPMPSLKEIIGELGVQAKSIELKRASRKLMNDLLEMGYGSTSDMPLPPSFDDLHDLLFSLGEIKQ